MTANQTESPSIPSDLKMLLGLTVGAARAVRLASRRTLKQANWASAIELDPGYVDTAVERWQRMTGQPAVHANGKTFDEMRSERLA